MSASSLSRLPQSVLEYICRLLMHQPCDSDGKMVGCRTVAYLASTCRCFHEPALNVLWHSIPDIALLFFALPTHRYQVRRLVLDETDKMDEKIFKFAGIPDEAGLVRFFSYARRVKAIRHYSFHLPPTVALFCANPETYHALAVILQDLPLLPNVNTIDYHRKAVVSAAVFRSFHILFGPKLQQLNIFSREGLVTEYAWLWLDPELGLEPQEEQDFSGMLAQLKKRVPRLEELSLNMYPSDAAMAFATSVAVSSGLQYLTSLRLLNDCLPIRPDAFIHLGALPNLRTLDVSSDTLFWTDADYAKLSNSESLFPMLQSLNFTGSTLAVPTKLLEYIGAPRLAELTVHTDDTLRSEIDPLIAAIMTLRSRDTLSVLCIHIPDVLHEPTPASRRRARAPEPLSRATFGPLMTIRGLEEVVLDIHCPLDLDDALLDLFAFAWPKLRKLNLGVPSPWGTLATDVRVGELHEVQYGDESTGVGAVQSHVVAPQPPATANPAAAQQAGVAAAAAQPAGADDDNWPDSDSDNEFADIEMMGAWTKPRVTLFGLVAFARHCPHINVLGLDFDACLSTVAAARLEQRPARGALRGLGTLFVGLSPIEDPWAVAAFLSDAFPWLREVEDCWKSLEDDEDEVDREGPERAWWSLPRLYGRRWDKVRELVPKFAKVRMHERQRKRMAARICPSEDQSDSKDGLDDIDEDMEAD